MQAARPLLEAPLLLGVGAVFEFVAGTKRRAPRWMQNAGLKCRCALLLPAAPARAPLPRHQHTVLARTRPPAAREGRWSLSRTQCSPASASACPDTYGA